MPRISSIAAMSPSPHHHLNQSMPGPSAYGQSPMTNTHMMTPKMSPQSQGGAAADAQASSGAVGSMVGIL